MTKKEIKILKKSNRVNGSSYRTNPRPNPSSKRFEREKELWGLDLPNIKLQKAYYEKF